MARPVRIHIPYHTYLVQLRARSDVSLFTGEEDRALFLHSLGEAAVPADVKIYAYALLEKSALLFLRSGPLPLSRFVHRTQAGFFNRLRVEKGESKSLINDRHRAILVEEHPQLFAEVVRRVHMAPVIGGHWTNISEGRRWGEVSTNRWTSFPLYANRKIASPEWFDDDYVLDCFKDIDEKRPVDAFYKYVMIGVKGGVEEDILDHVVAMSLLGSQEFVKKYYQGAKGRKRLKIDVTATKKYQQELDKRYKRILEVVSEHFEVESEQILKSRSRHPGRKFVVELAARYVMDAKGVKGLGERLNVSGSAIAHLRRGFEDAMKKDATLREEFDQIEKMIID